LNGGYNNIWHKIELNRHAKVNTERVKRLVYQAIEKFSLDLSNLTVLTEAASGYYCLTPIIAGLANAESVFAITRDSRFGLASEISDSTKKIAHRFGVESKISILVKKDDPKIGSADIVTNLGFVRPIDKDFLMKLKKTVVIPLMWETWEYRPEDLDLEQCRIMGIPVLGTNEHDPRLRTMEYVGHLALKMLYSQDVEVFMSKIVVLGSGEFGAQISTTIQSVGAHVVSIISDNTSTIDSEFIKDSVKTADAMVVAEHHNRNILIGPDGAIDPHALYKYNPTLCIVHICGGIDQKSIIKAGLRIVPNDIAKPGFMTLGTDYLGPKPLIDLHTAGLKIGELMSHARFGGAFGVEAELSVLKKSSLAQGFKNVHEM
jgi:hypothetical protein